MRIDDRLTKEEVQLIDGGLSNVLENKGYDLNHDLWTAHLLDNEPEAIIQAHLEYLNSGAQCITTASYQASIKGLIESGYHKEEAKRLILKSVDLAAIALQKFCKEVSPDRIPLIAASVGPYGAYLADGSEYRGDYQVSSLELEDFHRDRIMILDQSNADVLAIETIPSYMEAEVLANILQDVKTPAWISFSCKNESHINDGTAISDCVSLFENHPSIFALGANCTNPKYISGIINTIKRTGTSKKIIIYPNSGEVYDAGSKTWKGLSDPLNFRDLTKEWIDLGADIIGGCCRIGPGHIQRINDILD